MDDQLPIDFSAPPPAESADGISRWRADRRAEIEALAKKQGLPLGHRVCVTFENGPPLEGLLLLNEELLFAPRRPDARLHLRIGTADFHADEIASCIRLHA